MYAQIGKANFGEVWRAQGPNGCQVAVKIVDMTELGACISEWQRTQWLKSVRHPHLLPILDVWLIDGGGHVWSDPAQQQELIDHALRLDELHGTLFALGGIQQLLHTMPLADTALDQLAREQSRGHVIPLADLLGYLTDVAEALDYLRQPIHALGGGRVAFQHCDVKPANLLVTKGTVQLADFGIVQILGDSPLATPPGSLPCVSPECLRDHTPSAASDQYSLAVTYFELRTGQLPFSTPTSDGMIAAHLTGELNLTALA